MKKLFGLTLLLGTTATLAACGTIPECRGELDECTYGGPYTEERTVQVSDRTPPPPPPAPEPVVVVEPPPPAPPPAPTPEPIRDVEVMRSAEPEFQQITK